MNTKGSKYRSIISKNSRYKFSQNPLSIILNEEALFKSAEDTEQREEIQRIIQTELEEDFVVGGHADFNHLLTNIQDDENFFSPAHQIENVKLCSVFIDLRNFTRRALFVDDPGIETIQEIAKLKQRAISTWIKLARYYQAHIHSITGDGLMILIGGTQTEDEDEWTLGARAYLLGLRILESTDYLNEELKQELIKKDLASFANNHHNLLDIKVGVEYSPKTLINPQGVIVNINGQKHAVGEVKATSFEIDFSAKLLGYYNKVRDEKLEGSPRYGRVFMFGEKYIELMNFKEEVLVRHYANYEKQMFNEKSSRKVYYLDCKDFKDEVITLEDVARICDVYDNSEFIKAASIDIVREVKIQHG